MIIESLGVRLGMEAKSFLFSDGCTLICSNGTNAVGKTTLIRVLLYALGESVSGTQKFRFGGVSTKLVIRTDSNDRLKILRNGAEISVISEDLEQHFTLPFDSIQLKSRIYGINNEHLLGNLLGTFYIDQDKGWTLLNRGKVISDIHFNIEDFLYGIAGINKEKELSKLRQLNRDIQKYEFIVKAAGYRDSLVQSPGPQEFSKNKAKANERLSVLRMQNASLKKRIAQLRRAQKDNKRFVEHVERMGLRVTDSHGREIKVTSHNLVGYDDNVQFLTGEILSLKVEQREVAAHIQELEDELQADVRLFDVDDAAVMFDREFAGLNFDIGNIEKLLESLKAERRGLKKEMRDSIARGNAPYDFVTKKVDVYCDSLNVGDAYRRDSKGIMTSDLQSKSGTYYHLLVFAFRMAYASAVLSFSRVNLPLIIDSIRGREMSEANFRRCVSLLKTDMVEHQQIIASIVDEGIEADTTINITNRMMEDSKMIDDIGAWEAEW